ncbi:MAG: hypothetical protein JSV52_09065 [Candidatus Zixiibacteriota bacterium]|nr:MAG: hypothetical protein JSV52_09065 [candidate division Zixibacteria bacterium]
MKQIHNIDSVYKSLRMTLLKKRMVLFGAGVLVTAAVVVILSIILSAIASLAVLPVAIKISLLAATGLLTLVAFLKAAVSRLFSDSVESVAVDLETKFPELKGRLIAAIQFARMKKTPGYSAELMASTRQQAVENASQISFGKAIPFHPVHRMVRLLAVVLVVGLLLVIIAPGMFYRSIEVYSSPLTVVMPPVGYRLTAFPGSVQWIKYQDIEIGGILVGDKLPDKAVIHHRLAGGSWQETEVDVTKQQTHPLNWGDSVTFSTTLRQINKSFDYFVEAGKLETEIQRVDVVDRPRVVGIKLSLFYPEYTGLAPNIIDENNGSFSAVIGTRVNMQVTTNRPVETAELVFADSSRLPLTIESGAAITTLRVDSSRAYYVHLLDHLGERNPDPIEYYMTAIPDEYPSIDVVRPGFDVNLNDEMMLPLKVHIFDDFGFSSLVLKYIVISQGRQSEENVAVLHFSERIKTEGEIEFNWGLDQLNMFPGDFVSYYFEVADNDQISGPKITRSRRYIARLPSLDEIIAQAEYENARRITGAENILRTGKDLSERLRNVARKLQAQTNRLEQTDWQHQKELEALLDKNMEMVEQIEDLAQSMEKSLEELNDKALLSREILEKLQQVQQLFEEVATPEMKEAQRRLMEAIENMDPADLENAIRDFQTSQEEFLQRLERTLALLKKLQLEQAMESMLRKAEELARRQEEINERTEASSDSELGDISDDERQVNESFEQLQQKASELDELAREARMEQSPQLERFKQAVERSEAGEHMENMADALEQRQKNRAGSEGKKAFSRLMEMIDGMQQQLMAMKGGENEALMREMQMALQDANNLSRMQEELLNEAEDVGDQSMFLRDLATRQQDLSGATSGLKNRIDELGNQSPYVAAELRRLVNESAEYMNMAMQQFDNKRGRRAVGEQRQAIYSLNRASLRLMESLNQMQQSQSGANCDKGTSMLQGLADKQNLLNQMTQQQLGRSGINLELGEGGIDRQTLQRLAGEQGGIRKSLEQLNREFGQSRQILGRLDDIADEMQRVEEALSSGDVSGDLIDQQLKIYSRMLEASRSLYRKDFSEQRRSKTATNQAFHIPPELSREILEDRMKLEDRLHHYLGGSYPPQYEEQIKAYFRALLQAESNQMLPNNGDITPTEDQ